MIAMQKYDDNNNADDDDDDDNNNIDVDDDNATQEEYEDKCPTNCARLSCLGFALRLVNH